MNPRVNLHQITSPLYPNGNRQSRSSRPELFDTYAIGYRVWGVHGADLTGPFQGSAWTPGANRADTPRPGNGSGFYAYYRPPRVTMIDGPVWGAMLAWGRIEMHHGRFRAEYAMPIVLCKRRGASDDLVRALADRYHCEVADGKAQMREIALKHGEEIGQWRSKRTLFSELALARKIVYPSLALAAVNVANFTLTATDTAMLAMLAAQANMLSVWAGYSIAGQAKRKEA